MYAVGVASNAQPAPNEEAAPELPERRFWEVPWEFAVHGIIATAIFLVIAALAGSIDILVTWLNSLHLLSPEVVTGLKFGAKALFGTDLFLFLVFLVKTAYRTAKKL